MSTSTQPTQPKGGVAKEDLALLGGALVSVASSFAGGPPVNSGQNTMYDILISDLTIDGNSQVDSIQIMTNTAHMRFVRVRFDHPSFSHVYNSIGGSNINYTYDWFFDQCEFYNLGSSTVDSITFDTDDSIYIDLVTFKDCYWDWSCLGGSVNVGGGMDSSGYNRCNYINNIDLSVKGPSGCFAATGETHVFSGLAAGAASVSPRFLGVGYGPSAMLPGLGVATGGFGGEFWSFNNVTNLLTPSTTAGGNPTSGNKYTVFKCPMDVSIGAGTGQTITTTDELGNVIDNGVASLSHRLLLPGYTLTVTYTTIGTVSIYIAICGAAGTASAVTNVNYVVWNADDLILLGGSGLTTTTKDGTTNTGGNTIDNSITGNPSHPLSRGQIVTFTALTTSPTVVVNR